MQRVILGVSADYHDSAAALVVDGEVVCAAAEERFTRSKHDGSLPANAMRWCLEDAHIRPDELTAVAFYSKPMSTYERILMTHAMSGPVGLRSLAQAVSTWSRSKIWVGYRIERLLSELGFHPIKLLYMEHHQSHAASAFYPSPFEHAAVITLDGVGEWSTSSIGHGEGVKLRLLREMPFPDSIGLLYSTITAHCGFAVNDGEYKVMGLAPFGEPRFVKTLTDHVVNISADGSIRLNQRYFDYRSGRKMGSRHLTALLGPPRNAQQVLGQREADLARSIQVILETILLRIAAHAHQLTDELNVCLAGGVALNCVANSGLLDEGPFTDVWVQPAAGDDGGALGAALWAEHMVEGGPRSSPSHRDSMKGAFLGPRFDHGSIVAWLRENGIRFDAVDSHADLAEQIAGELADGSVVGWFQGRMEFGPRALGHRSILADPRDPTVVRRINQRIKQREGFRPFAPAVLQEFAHEWFDINGAAPYMVTTAMVAPAHLTPANGLRDSRSGSFADRLEIERSDIGACTHVDGSARIQTVDADRNPEFHALLAAFHQRTGCPVLLNTSFNGADEPIVRTPADAFRCFTTNQLDVLVLERCIVRRSWNEGRLGPDSAASGDIDR